MDGVQYDLVSVGMQESVFTVVAESESGNTQYETTKPPGEPVDDEEEGLIFSHIKTLMSLTFNRFGFPDSDDEEPKVDTASGAVHYKLRASVTFKIFSESGADSSTPNTKSQGGWGALMTVHTRTNSTK